MKQKTIKAPCSLSGIGIHSGNPVHLRLVPAPENTGLVFIRTDQHNAAVPASLDTLYSTPRATLLKKGAILIKTPEHLFAALHILEIDNLFIEMDSDEVPILDGSAIEFIHAIKKIGIQTLPADVKPIQLQHPIIIEDKEKSILAFPSKRIQFSYYLSPPKDFISPQLVSVCEPRSDWERTIASARTFGLLSEVEALKKKGLALGGSLDNALVIDETTYLNPPRYPDELAKHKLLDLVGDCWLLSRPILAHIIGIRSGHALTAQFLKQLAT